MIVNARRFIGITDIDEFWKLTPTEYDYMCEGAMLANNDELRRLNVASHFLTITVDADSQKANQIVQEESATIDSQEQTIIKKFKKISLAEKKKIDERNKKFVSILKGKLKK